MTGSRRYTAHMIIVTRAIAAVVPATPADRLQTQPTAATRGSAASSRTSQARDRADESACCGSACSAGVVAGPDRAGVLAGSGMWLLIQPGIPPAAGVRAAA